MLKFASVEDSTGTLHRCILDREGHAFTVQKKPMAKHYRTLDPFNLCQLLHGKGFSPRIVNRGRGLGIWRNAVVLDKDRENGYDRGLSILCGHDGKTGVRLVPWVIRGACSNEFQGAYVSIPHTSRKLDEFLNDPTKLFDIIYNRAVTLQTAIEGLRDKPATDKGLRLWLSYTKPAVFEQYRHKRDSWYRGDTAWDIVQAMSAARSPMLIEMASKFAGASYNGDNFDFDTWFSRELFAKRAKDPFSVRLCGLKQLARGEVFSWWKQ